MTTYKTHHPVRSFARNLRDRMQFNSEDIEAADYQYVGWLDMMGAGHVMSTSVHKSANFLARIHMAVDLARRDTGVDCITVAINDGIFILSPNKSNIMQVMRQSIINLSLHFIGVPRPYDKFLARGAIAYGPVYSGEHLNQGISAKRRSRSPSMFDNVMFGPPVIQAYLSESTSAPFGIAIHESARSFAPVGFSPFRMSHWIWWQNNNEAPVAPGLPPLSDIRSCLVDDLMNYIDWMDSSLIYHGVAKEKTATWRRQIYEYFGQA